MLIGEGVITCAVERNGNSCKVLTPGALQSSTDCTYFWGLSFCRKTQHPTDKEEQTNNIAIGISLYKAVYHDLYGYTHCEGELDFNVLHKATPISHSPQYLKVAIFLVHHAEQ